MEKLLILSFFIEILRNSRIGTTSRTSIISKKIGQNRSDICRACQLLDPMGRLMWGLTVVLLHFLRPRGAPVWVSPDGDRKWMVTGGYIYCFEINTFSIHFWYFSNVFLGLLTCITVRTLKKFAATGGGDRGGSALLWKFYSLNWPTWCLKRV